MDTQAQRDKVLADYQAILQRAEQGLGPAFDLRPNARLQIWSVPQYREANAPLAKEHRNSSNDISYALYALTLTAVVIGVLYVAREFIGVHTGLYILGAKPA